VILVLVLGKMALISAQPFVRIDEVIKFRRIFSHSKHPRLFNFRLFKFSLNILQFT